MDIKKCFGDNVRKLREQKGWSQENLADYSNLHRTYISGVERGVRNPTIEIVQKISIALEVNISCLFEEQDEI